MKLPKKHFTLIELLIVISIIGILAAIMYPVLGNIIQKGKISESKVVIDSVNAAIKTYDATYGKLPYSGNTSRDTQIGANGNNPEKYLANSTPSEYFKFCDVLTFTDHQDSSKTPDESSYTKKMNPKGQQFIAPGDNYFDEDNYCIRDSWGQSLLIGLDTDGDGKVSFSSSGGTSLPWGDNGVHNARCVVISIGNQAEKTIDVKEVLYSDKK